MQKDAVREAVRNGLISAFGTESTLTLPDGRQLPVVVRQIQMDLEDSVPWRAQFTADVMDGPL